VIASPSFTPYNYRVPLITREGRWNVIPMTALVECIPNFSEARRSDVVEKIAASITSIKDARLLDRSSDLDHNRTVLTFAGPPAAVEEAAYLAIKTASELIDLNQHTGQHRALVQRM